MDEDVVNPGAFRYRQLFPWVHLFRTFGIAIDLRKILLATLGLLAISAGNMLFWELPFAPGEDSTSAGARWPWEESFLPSGSAVGILDQLVVDPWSFLNQISWQWHLVLQPVKEIVEPIVPLFGSSQSWSETAFAWTQLLWMLCVWGLFGGAISRMVAVQFARDDRVGTLAAVRYSSKRLLAFIAAPLMPIVGIGVFWLLCMVAGLFGRIPVVGEVVVGALWIIPLVFGLVMSLILIGLAVGWPLMYATISAEGSDAFDGLSRSFSYVYDRPWYYLWLAILAMAYGSIVTVFVWVVASLLMHLTTWGVSAGLGEAAASTLPRSLFATADTDASQILPVFVRGWRHALESLVVGFVYSYFWTVTTVIYFLLRKSDDATELDEVFVLESEQEDDLLPLVGVAASQQPADESTVNEGDDSKDQTPSGSEDDGNSSADAGKPESNP